MQNISHNTLIGSKQLFRGWCVIRAREKKTLNLPHIQQALRYVCTHTKHNQHSARDTL